MNYQLAKQLEDAGFPYDPANIIYEADESTWPTLSELIEACGYDFDELFQGKPKGNSWRATASRYENDGTGNTWQTPFAPTPEEAVAKLWLALHPTSTSSAEKLN